MEARPTPIGFGSSDIYKVVLTHSSYLVLVNIASSSLSPMFLLRLCHPSEGGAMRPLPRANLSEGQPYLQLSAL